MARRGPGRPSRGDAFYRRVAIAYRRCMKAGDRRPIQTLAAQFDETPENMRNLVHQARKYGFLTAGRKGKAGGEVTIKCAPPMAPGLTEKQRAEAFNKLLPWL